MNDQLGIEWWPPTAIAAVAGLLGIVSGAFLTAWLAVRRDRTQRRLDFIEKQLSEFYSPMVGLRSEVRTFTELRVKLQDAAGDAWRELADDAGPGPQAEQLTASRFPQFKALIEHDNSRFNERLMPAYREMVDLFRGKLWLAEDETRQYYPTLVEFVDVWDRWLGGSLPHEVIDRTGHSEVKLHPFYEHLETQHTRLRRTLADGALDNAYPGGPMSVAADRFKITLNQNLWALLLSFLALGAAEYFHLRTLCWFSSVASAATLLSVIFTTVAYTWRYCKNKLAA